jgi:hypothetical protein
VTPLNEDVPLAGDRIQLIHMPEDPAPIEDGATGTVRRVHRFGTSSMQIGVEWDNGRTLHLVVPPDTYRIIERLE